MPINIILKPWYEFFIWQLVSVPMSPLTEKQIIPRFILILNEENVLNSLLL